MTCDEIVRALAEFRAIGATKAKAAADKSTATPTPDATYRKERVRAVLGSLVDPPGLSDWVKAECPDLTTHGWELAQQIDAAWCAPLAEFERALERLAEHHGECCREFGVRQGNPASGFLEGRRDTGRGREG